MIALKNISKTFSGRTILDDINLRFDENKTHVLLGASGGGKSTILRLVMGLTWPETGSISIQGETLTKTNQKKIASKIGYVVQDSGLFPHLTARKNILLPIRSRHGFRTWNTEEIQEKIHALSSLVGFDLSTMEKYPRQLSGGQKQRVSLMRALILNPDLLILDEPLSALDPLVKASLRVELKSTFNKLGKTVILVTHDLEEAAFFGHTVTLIHDGKVAQHGSFADLAKKPSSDYVRNYIDAQRPSHWMTDYL